jgi:hypothetical protein
MQDAEESGQRSIQAPMLCMRSIFRAAKAVSRKSQDLQNAMVGRSPDQYSKRPGEGESLSGQAGFIGDKKTGGRK